MVSTHHNLMETFPAFCFAAAMVQSLAPADVYVSNLLGLHVILKVKGSSRSFLNLADPGTRLRRRSFRWATLRTSTRCARAPT